MDALTISDRGRRKWNRRHDLQRVRSPLLAALHHTSGRSRPVRYPPGLSLDPAGTIVGTPTAPGTSLFSVQAADSSTGTPQTATHNYSITVIAPLDNHNDQRYRVA